jgi:hypothetical protein
VKESQKLAVKRWVRPGQQELHVLANSLPGGYMKRDREGKGTAYDIRFSSNNRVTPWMEENLMSDDVQRRDKMYIMNTP